eukprot:s683_g9.t1
MLPASVADCRQVCRQKVAFNLCWADLVGLVMLPAPATMAKLCPGVPTPLERQARRHRRPKQEDAQAQTVQPESLGGQRFRSMLPVLAWAPPTGTLRVESTTSCCQVAIGRVDALADGIRLGETKESEGLAEVEILVKDMGLAEFGRKELTLAEHEMPGLMAARKEYGPGQPFKGLNINGSLHMTIQTGVLIETLAALGAKANTATVFAWKGETLPEYWWCTEQMMTVPGADGCDQLVDDGGDATLLGKELEEKFAKDGSLPDPASTTNAEFKCVLQVLRDSIQADKTKYTRMAAKCKGVSEETTTGVHRLREMAAKGELLFPAINVNDCVTKSKFDNVYGCRHSLPDSIMRATDVMIGGKRALVAGYGDVGKGCAFAMRGAGARVLITEIDPICALQACMEGFQVVTIEECVGEVDIFTSATGNFKIITLDHMKKMKNNAIVCNIGHFDNEIAMEDLETFPGIKVENIKPQVDRFVFPDGHGVIVLASGRLVSLELSQRSLLQQTLDFRPREEETVPGFWPQDSKLEPELMVFVCGHRRDIPDDGQPFKGILRWSGGEVRLDAWRPVELGQEDCLQLLTSMRFEPDLPRGRAWSPVEWEDTSTEDCKACQFQRLLINPVRVGNIINGL